MATVPTYDSPQVAPAGAPGVQLQGLSPRQLMQGEIAGHEQEQAGQNVENLGIQGMDATAKENMMANQVRVDSALNDVRAAQQKLTYDPESGYLGQKGKAAIEPNDQGQGLQDQYGSKLQDAISTASANLANDAQRQVFQKQAANLATSFDGQIQSHVLSEYKNFGLQTQQGTIQLAADAAEKNWNNPDAIDTQIASVKSAVWKAGQISGEPANLIEAKTEQQTSAIHTAVVNAALQNNNPQYALQYIQKYKGDMTAGDLLKTQGLITADMNARVATSTAQTAMNTFSSAITPTGADRMLHITEQAESGGRDTNADGSPLQSTFTKPDGTIGHAKYRMQTTDDTAQNPGHGVAPAASDTPAEYNRVGTQLLAELTKKYAGDPAKAWAAYNWGEGNVDAAIKKDGANWIADAPQATKDYVQKNVTALQSGDGAPPLPTIQDLHNNIRQQLGPNPEPRLLSAALAEGTRQFTDAMKSREEQGNQAVQAAQQYLIQNKGDFNSLPPDIRDQVTQLAPGKFTELQSFASKIANPVVKDDMGEYLQAFEHPEVLAKMPDAAFNNYLTQNFTEATQKQLANQRSNFLSGKTDTGPATLNEPVFKRELNNRMQSVGLLDPKGQPVDRDQAGTLSNYLRNEALKYQQQTGQKMTEDQIVKFVDGQFNKSTALPGMLWGTNPKSTLSMNVSDIPSAQRDQIKQSLAAKGNTNPSNDQILRTYWIGNK
ncbi:soluble lytic murein transglycosylase [Oxalobacteraceae bacterium GrIS 2.11]